MALTLKEVAEATGGRLLGEDLPFQGIATDSRKRCRGALFVALRGERFDGHQFVEVAARQGAVAALVSRPLPLALPQVVVAETRSALGEIGKLWREKWFRGTLIAVTGSNGKTSVKEMVARLLGEEGVLKTEGNLNNEVGVPLTLCRLRPDHRFAVIEMGARKRGDIAYLTGIARPEIGIVTGAGPAHLETFGSLQGVAEAKGEMFQTLPPGGTAVINADDRFAPFWERMAGERHKIRFGFSRRAEVRAVEVEPLRFLQGRFQNRFRAITPLGQLTVQLQLAGRHNVYNALAAIAVAIRSGRPLGEMARDLAAIEPISGRLRPLRHLEGGILLDDCYNANPASFEAALEALEALGGERWVVMGGLAELGSASRNLHAEIGRRLRQLGVERLFALGEETAATVEAFGVGGCRFGHREVLLEALLGALHGEVNLLVKGSRRYRLETVVQALTVPDGPREKT